MTGWGVVTLLQSKLHHQNYWQGSVFAPFSVVIGALIRRRLPLRSVTIYSLVDHESGCRRLESAHRAIFAGDVFFRGYNSVRLAVPRRDAL